MALIQRNTLKKLNQWLGTAQKMPLWQASPTHWGNRGECRGTPGQSWAFQWLTRSSVEAAALQLPWSRNRTGTEHLLSSGHPTFSTRQRRSPGCSWGGWEPSAQGWHTPHPSHRAPAPTASRDKMDSRSPFHHKFSSLIKNQRKWVCSQLQPSEQHLHSGPTLGAQNNEQEPSWACPPTPWAGLWQTPAWNHWPHLWGCRSCTPWWEGPRPRAKPNAVV